MLRAQPSPTDIYLKRTEPAPNPHGPTHSIPPTSLANNSFSNAATLIHLVVALIEVEDVFDHEDETGIYNSYT